MNYSRRIHIQTPDDLPPDRIEIDMIIEEQKNKHENN